MMTTETTRAICHVCGRIHQAQGRIMRANTRLAGTEELPVSACKGHTAAEVRDAYNRVILGREPIPQTLQQAA